MNMGVPVELTIKNRKLRRNGECVVAEFLEPLRARAYRVFDGIPGGGCNLDHVIVGHAGVLTIETKTRSKPSCGCYPIVYDGEIMGIGKRSPTIEPLICGRRVGMSGRRLVPCPAQTIS